MSEVKKIATRESYGNALQQQLRPVCSRRYSLKDILTVVLQRVIWLAWQQDFP